MVLPGSATSHHTFCISNRLSATGRAVAADLQAEMHRASKHKDVLAQLNATSQCSTLLFCRQP